MKKLLDATYDAEADALYVSLAPDVGDGAAVRQVVAEAIPDRGEVILDFDGRGRLLGVEVLGASRLVSADLIAAARKL